MIGERVPRPHGAVRTYYVEPQPGCYHCVPDLRLGNGILDLRMLPGLWQLFAELTPNLVMYDHAVVAANLLTGHPEFKVAAMYFEFQNVAAPTDLVTAPSYDRSGGKTYYDALESSPDTDYLRVPIIAATVTSTNQARWPRGNLATFYAQTSGTVGVHGKPFSDAVNSKVFGACIVATPNFDDPTQDLVVSRWYFPTGRQQVKLPSSQIAVEWPLTHD